MVAATFFVAIRFRDKDGTRRPKQTHGNSVLEIGWTILPALLLAVIGAIMTRYDRGSLFWGLILPHGLLELTAVFVAAGVGLLTSATECTDPI